MADPEDPSDKARVRELRRIIKTAEADLKEATAPGADASPEFVEELGLIRDEARAELDRIMPPGTGPGR